MTVSILDPISALIVIDLQKGITALPTAHPVARVIAHAAMLADAFRRHDLPVVLVNVTGGAPGRTEQSRAHFDRPADWAELVPELNRQPRDHVVTKQTPGAFTRTDLAAYLASVGATQVIIAGVATSNGVEATARQAYELGFNVTLAIDAMTDRDATAHDHSVNRIFPRIGETGTTRDILALLEAAA